MIRLEVKTPDATHSVESPTLLDSAVKLQACPASKLLDNDKFTYTIIKWALRIHKLCRATAWHDGYKLELTNKSDHLHFNHLKVRTGLNSKSTTSKSKSKSL